MPLMNLRASTALAVLLTMMPAATEAQNRALTLDDLYNPSTLINFSGRPISGLAWLNDTHYIWPRPASGGVDWVKVNASTGAMEPLFDAKQMERALTKLASIPPGEAEQLSRSRDLVFNCFQAGLWNDAGKTFSGPGFDEYRPASAFVRGQHAGQECG